MESISLFKITSNSDTIEGRGPEIIHGYTRDLETAKEIVQDPRYAKFMVMGIQKNNDWMYCTKQVNLKIFESVGDFYHNDVEQIKIRALSKLTPIEREALGL